jgi:hypothetical protein
MERQERGVIQSQGQIDSGAGISVNTSAPQRSKAAPLSVQKI